ncbi:MAG: selenocysteine-specific translation elongation factor [Rhodospirillales bacterium]|nr:selenocysteine-specific translation elongation factor [Rhodospirillales bacterium]
MIVATAGHVDHGKTALIGALTGVDTDHLPEEKSRGLTIDLGYAYLPLDSGKTIGFIDVPGHERFLRNMVAGVAGIDLGLLVVAADDGVMPQTIEHATVLSLLGVDRALVAVTKADRVSSYVCEAAREDAQALLQGLSIKVLDTIATAAPEGRGIDEVREVLRNEASRLPPPETTGGFRLAVDRVFVIRGAGVVVTGTVHAGRAAIGDRLVLMPSGREVRIRGIHAQDAPAEQTVRGERTALNLSGIDRDDVTRGDWVVTPEILAPSYRIDVELSLLGDNKTGLKHWTPVHAHHGAGHTTGRLALLEHNRLEPGQTGLAQLVTDEPLVGARGDRLVFRDSSARRTIAGGTVLDPRGPSRGRAKDERLAVLRLGAVADTRDAFVRYLATARNGFDPVVFLNARNLPADDADVLIRRSDVHAVESRLVLREDHWNALMATVTEAVETDHRQNTDRLGPTAQELRRLLPTRPPMPLLDAAIRALTRDGDLIRQGAVVHRPAHRVTLKEADTRLWARVEAALDVTQGSPPALFPLAEGLDMTPGDLKRFLDRMVACGLTVKIGRNRYLTPSQVDRAVADAAAESAAQPDGFTVAQFRDRTGIGRNLAIDLLEYLDRRGVTRRRGDLRQAPQVP